MNTRNFPLLHRWLHWSLAIAMLFILLTVLLRLGWMEKNHIANILIIKLTQIDILISKEQATSIAKAIRNVMFQWHLYFGYAVGIILVMRLIYMAKYGLHYVSAFSAQSTLKQKIQAWVYWLFYIGIAMSVITGLCIKFGPEKYEHLFETIHKLALWYFVPFLALHLIGIIIAECKTDKGIVSKMIGG